MKLFKIILFLLLGFAAKTTRSQTQQVHSANWCVSFTNPKFVPTVNDMSYIFDSKNWIKMGRWKSIPGTGIDFSPNLNSMSMWADTTCSIINRKCDPPYLVTPTNISTYILYECIITEMSGVYRNYNAKLITGVFGYEDHHTFAKGTLGIADRRSGICFMKVSDMACANPCDPEIKRYVPQPLPMPVPVPQPAPAAVVPPAPAPALAAAPDLIPPPDESAPALENKPQGTGNTYNTYNNTTTNNYYYGNQQSSDEDVIYTDRQDDYRHRTSNYDEPGYDLYNPYYRPHRQRLNLYLGVNVNQSNVQLPNLNPNDRPFDPRTNPTDQPYDPTGNSNERPFDPRVQ